MTIYLISIGSILIYGLMCFYSGTTERRKRIFLSLAFTHLGLLMALRAPSVGTDTVNYSRLFLVIGDSTNFFDVITSAPVFSLYNKFIYMIAPYPQAIIISNSVIISICVAVFIYHFSDDVVFSTYCYLALYFYFSSFNANRQFLAVSLTLIAACLLKEGKEGRKTILSTIFVLLAIGIHNIAIVSVPFLFLGEKLTQKKLFLLTIITSGILFAYEFLFNWLVTFFVKLFPRYQMYLGESIFSVYDTGQGRNIIVTLLYLIFVIATFGILRKRRQLGYPEEWLNKMQFILFFSAVSVILGLTAADNLMLGRIRSFFSIYFICLIPNTIRAFRREKVILYLYTFVVLFIPCFIQLSEKVSGVVPYRLFWN